MNIYICNKELTSIINENNYNLITDTIIMKLKAKVSLHQIFPDNYLTQLAKSRLLADEKEKVLKQKHHQDLTTIFD